MKNTILSLAFALAFAVPTFAASDPPEEVKLIYPTDAAAAELDSSTPAKRVEPPVREDSEQDVVTPLGQVRYVVETLGTIEAQQKTLAADVSAIKSLDLSELLADLKRAREERREIAAALSLATKERMTLREELKEATEKLTARTVGGAIRSKIGDTCLFILLALLLLQFAARIIKAVGAWIRQKTQERDAAIVARALAQTTAKTVAATFAAAETKKTKSGN